MCHEGRNAKSYQIAFIAPVDDILSDEFAVWNNHSDVVVRSEMSTSRSDRDYLTIHAADLDTIADLNRTFDKEYQPAYEIGRYILQAKANAYPYRTREYVKSGEIDADRLENNYKADKKDQIAGDGPDRLACAVLQWWPCKKSGDEQLL